MSEMLVATLSNHNWLCNNLMKDNENNYQRHKQERKCSEPKRIQEKPKIYVSILNKPETKQQQRLMKQVREHLTCDSAFYPVLNNYYYHWEKSFHKISVAISDSNHIGLVTRFIEVR